MERYESQYASYLQECEAWTAAKPRDRGPKPPEPRLTSFYTSDATPESLAPMLADTYGLAIICDELSGWINGMDQYKSGSKGRERQAHLELWAGGSIKIDRKGKPSILVDQPVIAVVGGIQPSVLRTLGGQAQTEDGFIDRFLWSVPYVHASKWTEDQVEVATRHAFIGVFTDLASRVCDAQLSPEARERWISWWDENVLKVESCTESPRGMLAKLPIQLARITLVLHCLDHRGNDARDSVSLATLEAAIEIVSYHEAHGRYALELINGHASGRHPGGADTGRVLALLKARVSSVSSTPGARITSIGDHSLYQWMSRSELLRATNLNRSRLEPILEDLLDSGEIEARPTKPSPAGGRPGTDYRYRPEETEITSCDDQSAA